MPREKIVVFTLHRIMTIPAGPYLSSSLLVSTKIAVVIPLNCVGCQSCKLTTQTCHRQKAPIFQCRPVAPKSAWVQIVWGIPRGVLCCATQLTSIAGVHRDVSDDFAAFVLLFRSLVDVRSQESRYDGI